jgi:hypothetical protein
MGSTPPSAFGINFQISTGPDGMAKTGVVRVELSGAGDSPDGLKAEIAPLLDVSAPFRLEIEVDAGGESVRARINEDAWSESVRMAYPWSEVRYMRIYQRLLQVRVKRIEFFE